MPLISELDWTPHKHIGLDLDETVAHSAESMIRMFHKQGKFLGVPNASGLITYNWHLIPGADITLEELKTVGREHKLITSSTLPSPGVEQALMRLHRKEKEFSIVTARDEGLHSEDTKMWLAQHLATIPFRGYYFANHLETNQQKRSKGAICREEGITLLIDDAVHNVEDSVQHGIHAILIQKPWNRKERFTHPLLYHARNWNEIEASIQRN